MSRMTPCTVLATGPHFCCRDHETSQHLDELTMFLNSAIVLLALNWSSCEWYQSPFAWLQYSWLPIRRWPYMPTRGHGQWALQCGLPDSPSACQGQQAGRCHDYQAGHQHFHAASDASPGSASHSCTLFGMRCGNQVPSTGLLLVLSSTTSSS